MGQYNTTANASRTLTREDCERIVQCDSGAAVVLTVPIDTLLGTSDRASVAIGAYQGGVGAVSFSAGAGVTIRGTAPTAAQYSTVGIWRVGANEWAYL